jgi:hypothetical protein
MLDHVAYHYCKIANLADIFRDGALLPAPPLPFPERSLIP